MSKRRNEKKKPDEKQETTPDAVLENNTEQTEPAKEDEQDAENTEQGNAFNIQTSEAASLINDIDQDVNTEARSLTGEEMQRASQENIENELPPVASNTSLESNLFAPLTLDTVAAHDESTAHTGKDLPVVPEAIIMQADFRIEMPLAGRPEAFVGITLKKGQEITDPRIIKHVLDSSAPFTIK